MELARLVGCSLVVKDACRLESYVDAGTVPTQNNEAKYQSTLVGMGKMQLGQGRHHARALLAL